MDTQTPGTQTEAPVYTAAPTPAGGEPAPVRRRKRPNRVKRILKASLTALIVLGVVGGLVFFSWKVFFAPEPMFYNTGYVQEREHLFVSVYGDGYLNPSLSEELFPKTSIPSVIQDCLVYLGMPVQKGDLLYTINPDALNEAISAQRDAIALLEKEIEGVEKEIARVEEQLSIANAEQIAMQKAAKLYAPFSGTMIEVTEMVQGQTVAKGQPLGRLIDDSKMKLTLYFSYGYEKDIYIGQSCEVSIPSAMAVVTGKVTAIEKVRRVDADGTVSFEVEITLANPGALTRGVTASASMKTASGEAILPVAAGELRYNQEEVIVAESQGPLKSLAARNYFPYKQGDLLMEIDFQADNSIAEGYLLSIETHRQSIDSKIAQITEKMLQIAELEASRADLNVTAPLSGVITQMNAYPGMAADASAMIRISQNETLVMPAFVDERNIRALSVDMVVEVYVSGMMGESMVNGTITSIDFLSPNMDYGYARYPVSITIDNSDGGIIDGQYGYFNYKTQEAFNALVVPIQAVRNTYMGPCVFVKESTRSEVAKRQAAAAIVLEDDSVPPGFYAIPVKTGITEGRVVQVTGELEKGWEVYLSTTNVEPSPKPTPEEEDGDDDETDDGIIDGGELVPGVDEKVGDADIGEGMTDEGLVDGGEDGIIVLPGIDEGWTEDGGLIIGGDEGWIEDNAVWDDGIVIDDGMVALPGVDEDGTEDGGVTDEGAAASEDTAVSDSGIAVMPMPAPEVMPMPGRR